MAGWDDLGAAFGGTSEKAYQEGLALGAKTEDALAQARERVEKNAARARIEQDLMATGLDAKAARAASTSLSAGAALTDPIQLMLKNQELGFRAKAGDPNVPLDIGQRSLLGVASGPVEPIYKVGNRAFNKFETPDTADLGAVFGGESGGNSAFMQAAAAFGLLNEDGTISPENRELAFEIMRNTTKVFDEGGVSKVFSGNPYSVRGPRSAPPALGAPMGGAPPQGPAAAGPTPAASAPAAVRPLSTVQDVAANAATIAAAKESGQMAGRNAAGLESTNATIDKFEQDIDKFTSMPGYDNLYGNIQGTEIGKAVTGVINQNVANARAAFDSLGGEAFLASIQKMRGFGQLSNQEGAKVQTALTRALDSRISPEESKRAWQEVKLHLAELKRVAAQESQVRAPGQAPAAAAPAAPAAGESKVIGGKTYVKVNGQWFEDDGT